MVRREFYGLNFSLKIEKKALRDDFKVFFLKKLEIMRKNAIFRFVFIFIGNTMMKRQLMGAGILSLGLLLWGCGTGSQEQSVAVDVQTGALSGQNIEIWTLIWMQASTSDTLAFKEEYESLNDTGHLHIEVPTTMDIDTLEFSELKQLLSDSKTSGIFYFGFPTCPWCRNLLPELFAAMQENGLSKLYYYNPKAIRDKKVLNESGVVVTEVETGPEYQYLLERLDEVLPEYEGLNDPKIKRLYVPFVVVLKDGKIVGHHLSTLDEQTDPAIPLTDELKHKLRKVLTEQFSSLIQYGCDPTAAEHVNC